jgi:hypothetical protein
MAVAPEVIPAIPWSESTLGQVAWGDFVEPWIVLTDDEQGWHTYMAALPLDAVQGSLFVRLVEPYQHLGHRLECRFYRACRSLGDGVEEVSPHLRTDRTGSLSVSVRRVRDPTDFREVMVHDVIGYTFLVPHRWAAGAWSVSDYVIHHRGRAGHRDSRLFQMEMMEHRPHQQGAGRAGGKGRRGPQPLNPAPMLCSANCPCVLRRAAEG